VHGKTIVITGASTGIGEELAVALAARGAHLVLAARGTDGLEKAVRRCIHAGGHAIAVPTDVTDPEACRALVDRAVEAFGGIDALVCNAGISMWARFRDVTDLTLFERIMKVNYLGAVYCTHFALPHVVKRKGLLVAISSLTGKTGVPTRTGYAASKHAMQGFFDSLRIELMDAGVDVLVVSPGFVATDIRARALGPDGKPLEESPREEKHNDTMDVHECVSIIVKAMQKREREVVMTPKAKVGLFLKLVAPSLVDRIAARAVKEK
jgi:NAD(P)-dependent dehydrogenase (short-subunit alcohol dehydrogenase family)